MSYPKTIIITAVPNRSGIDLLNRRANFQNGFKPNIQGKPISLIGENKHVKIIPMHPKKPLTLVNEDASYIPTRKRQRLDHLSMEEKIMRRKLKNRVAAQSARDRKKMKMDELEVVVQQLEAEKAELEEENARLKNMNMLLETENQYLKKGTTTTTTSSDQELKQEPETDLTEKMEIGASLEHASLISGPLLKEQGRPLHSHWMTQFVCLQMIMNLMTSSTCSSTAAKSSSNAVLSQKILTKLLKELDLDMVYPLLKWWGPQQKTWNPSKN